jgi:PAS domain S-box-containing protein
MQERTVSNLKRYGVALLNTALATIAREALNPLLQTRTTFITYILAAIITAWYGGLGPALVVVGLGAIISAYLFLPPQNTPLISDSGNLLSLTLFILVGTAIAILSEVLHRATRKAREAARALREQRELLRVTLSSIGDGVITTDTEGRITFMNPVAERLTGWNWAEAKGAQISEVFKVINENTREPVESPVKNALKEGAIVGLANHSLLITKSGDEIPIDDSGAPIRNDRGEVEGVVLVFHDITKRRRAERAVQVWQQVFNHASWGVVIANPSEGTLEAVNPAYARMHGYTVEEMKGMPLIETIAPEARADWDEKVHVTHEQGHNIYESLHIRKDGTRFPVLMDIAVIKDEEGRIIYRAASLQDITERKLGEEARERLAAIVESSDDAILSKTLDGRITSWNAGAEKMYGYAREEAIGRHVSFLAPPDRLDEVAQIQERLRHGEHIAHLETVRVRKDGVRINVSVSISPIRDGAGAVVGASTIARDITEQKRAEAALIESEERYRELFENANDIIYTLDLEGNLTSLNKAGERITGYRREDVLNTPIAAIVAPEYMDTMVQMFDRKVEGENLTAYELEIIAKDARRLTLEISSRLVFRDGNAVGVQGMARDITQRKRAEAALKESEERFAKAFNASPLVLTISSLADGKLIEVNETFVTLSGYSREEAIGKTTVELGLWSKLQDREEELESVRELGQVRNFEYRFRIRSGGERVGLLSAERIEIGGAPCALTVIQDITERKRAEEERARLYNEAREAVLAREEALRLRDDLLKREQAARAEAETANRAKDEFLATVSHELRTPLNAILGWSHMLRNTMLDEATTARALETIDRNAKSQAQLVEDILDVSRIITGNLRLDVRPVELSLIIESAIDSVRPAIEAKGIRLESVLDPRAGPVPGDSSRLQQVVWNLLSNAVKFTDKGGRVQVRLERVNSHIEITVSDTGRGIKTDFLPHVFDRFRQADSTSTRQHGGLGLGLAIVRHLVEMHGGTVEADSPGEGLGATFTVKLPLMIIHKDRRLEERVHPTAATDTIFERSSMLNGLCLLVVDDERDTRELLVLILSEFGAEVKTCGTAIEALEMLEQVKPDVLISDIEMPDEDGYTFIRQVRKLDAERARNTPAVALTAYARVEDRMRALAAGFQMHVSKPVEPAELAVVIASLVERTGRKSGA